RIRHAIRLRQRLGDLILRAEAHLDEDLAQKLLVIAAALFFERALQLFGLDQALVSQQLAKRFSSGGGYHRIVFKAPVRSAWLSNRCSSRVISRIFRQFSSRWASFTWPKRSSALRFSQRSVSSPSLSTKPAFSKST